MNDILPIWIWIHFLFPWNNCGIQIDRQTILIGGTGDRGVVASCSYEARKYGIHSAMPMNVARRLCSHAIVVQSDMEQYSKYSGSGNRYYKR